MNRHLTLGSVSGIRIQVHWTFALLLAWVAWLHWAEAHQWRDAGNGLLLVLGAFGCVVLHELGHALTALQFGIRTRSITLFPMGGVAELDRMPPVAWQELLVALAGPAVNLAIAGGLFMVLVAEAVGRASTLQPSVQSGVLVNLLAINVIQAVFNLLPAFPMDGGRVLRAVLSLFTDRVQATRHAAFVGEMFAIGFAVVGLLANPFLLFIALFVYLGAQQESRAVEVEAGLTGVRVIDALHPRFSTLRPDAPLRVAVNALLEGNDEVFVVVDEGGAVRGLLTRPAIMRALSHEGIDRPIGDAMMKDPPLADVDEPLYDAWSRMVAAHLPTLPVVENGRLVGVLTPGLARPGPRAPAPLRRVS